MIPTEYVLPSHRCRPTPDSGYRAHDAPEGIIHVCKCGKRWTPTRTHHGPDGRICGCGWLLIEDDGYGGPV